MNESIETEVKRRHPIGENAKAEWRANTLQAVADDMGISKAALRRSLDGGQSELTEAGRADAMLRLHHGKEQHRHYLRHSQSKICTDLGISSRRYKSITEDKPKRDPVMTFLTMKLRTN